MPRTKRDIIAVVIGEEAEIGPGPYDLATNLEICASIVVTVTLGYQTDGESHTHGGRYQIWSKLLPGYPEARQMYWQRIGQIAAIVGFTDPTALIIERGRDISNIESVRDTIEFHPDEAIIAPRFWMVSHSEYRADGIFRPQIEPIAAPYRAQGQFLLNRTFPDYVYEMPSYLAPFSIYDYGGVGQEQQGSPVVKRVPLWQ